MQNAVCPAYINHTGVYMDPWVCVHHLSFSFLVFFFVFFFFKFLPFLPWCFRLQVGFPTGEKLVNKCRTHRVQMYTPADVGKRK